MKADSQTESEIKALVEAMWNAYARKDLSACMAFYTGDPDLTAIGTGADQVGVGPQELREGLRRDFEEANNIKITTEWLSISAAGDVAWSASLSLMTALVGTETISLQCRMTAVYEKRDGAWRITQSHLSLPAAEQEIGTSWPTG